jgi:hypothetical protein
MLERIGEMRVRAWRRDFPNEPSLLIWLDDFDRTSRHQAFLLGGEPLAAARFSVHSCIEEAPDFEGYMGVFQTPPRSPFASFNRLVVDPAVRGRGLRRQRDLI